MQISKLFPLHIGILLSACAQIIPPTGGEKDVEAPTLLFANPPNETVNFNSSTIELQFDEYIQLKDVNQELLISPPLKSKPKVVQKKRGLFVSFDEELLPNTTYSLHFGQSISDLNEGNVLPLRYVFSTGPVLDSMFIAGKVIDAQTGEGISGAKVMLYERNIDSLPLLERPLYFAKSTKDGSFRATNLKAGVYKIFALEESNGNYLYDSEDERIAFSDAAVAAVSNDSLSLPLRLMLAAEYHQPKFIDFQRRDSDGLLVAFPDKPWAEVSVEYSGPGSVIYQKDKNTDSLRIWLDYELLPGKHEVIISNNEEALDTLEIEVLGDLDKKLLANCITGPRFKPEDGIAFSTDPRVKSVNVDLVQLMGDSVPIPFELNPGNWPGTWTVSADFKDVSNYELTMKPLALTYGYKSNDTLVCSTSAHPLAFYGNLNLSLQIKSCPNCILQLLNNKDEVVSSSTPTEENQKFDFKELFPGNYKIRILKDQDLNGKLSPPKYLQNIQPEVFIYYPKPINVRSNWDMEITWELISLD